MIKLVPFFILFNKCSDGKGSVYNPGMGHRSGIARDTGPCDYIILSDY